MTPQTLPSYENLKCKAIKFQSGHCKLISCTVILVQVQGPKKCVEGFEKVNDFLKSNLKFLRKILQKCMYNVFRSTEVLIFDRHFLVVLQKNPKRTSDTRLKMS